MNDQPLVSVIIPTFNNNDKVLNAIKSVKKQTYKKIEIIVVDDCSDHPIQIPKDVILIRNRKNRGPSFSRNLGVAKSNGNLIAFLDSDDLWMPDKLEVQVDCLKNIENQKQPIVISCSAIRVDKCGKTETRVVKEPNNSDDFLMGSWFYPGSSMLIKKNDYLKIGKLKNELRRLEDYEFFIRFKLLNGNLKVCHKPLCIIHRHNHASSKHVFNSAKIVATKHINNLTSFKSKLILFSYLSLEIGATFFFEKRFFRSILFLAVSLFLWPRLNVSITKNNKKL